MDFPVGPEWLRIDEWFSWLAAASRFFSFMILWSIICCKDRLAGVVWSSKFITFESFSKIELPDLKWVFLNAFGSKFRDFFCCIAARFRLFTARWAFWIRSCSCLSISLWTASASSSSSNRTWKFDVLPRVVNGYFWLQDVLSWLFWRLSRPPLSSSYVKRYLRFLLPVSKLLLLGLVVDYT